MTPARGQRDRVDWDAAKAFYIGLGPDERSYPRVSAEFAVSVTTVKKRAKRHGWVDAAAGADAAAAEAALNRAVRSRSERVEKVLLLVDDAVDHAAAKLKDKQLDVKPSDVASLVKLAELLTGEPTDRIQVAQLQPLLDEYDRALDELRDLAADKTAADSIIRRLDDDLLAFAAQSRLHS